MPAVKAMPNELNKNTEELASYKYLAGARNEVCEKVKEKLELFNSINKA